MAILRYAGPIVVVLLAACGPKAVGPAATPPARTDEAPGAVARYGAPRTLGIDVAGMDRSARPQDDLYRFVNGRWMEETEIPTDRSEIGSFSILAMEAEEDLRAIIEEVARAPGKAMGSEARKIGALYLSYMDTARIEALGMAPVRPDLERNRAVRDRATLLARFAELQRLGVQTPFAFYVAQDAKRADRYIGYLSQSGLGLPDRDYYLRAGEQFEKLRAGYAAYVERLLALAGRDDAAKVAADLVALEKQLAERHWTRVQNRDRNATYNLHTVEERAALAPGIDWRAFLAAVGAGTAGEVVVRQPDYLKSLDALIDAVPLATWQAYLDLKVLDAAAPYLSRDFVDASFSFRGRLLQGLEADRPRWKRGVGVVERALGQAVGKMYVERHFPPEAKARMQELVANLMAAFDEGIDQLEWMGPATKAQAKAKLAKFNVKIGYPDKWRDYSALEIRPDDLLGNLRRAARFEHEDMVGRLGKPVDRDEWRMTPQTVNAYYSPSLNEIVFPAAILQPPFFDLQADDAVNYGAIGAVIGHEISHGFDDQGRKSDGDGNLRDWWTPEDAAAFEARTRKLVEQYARFNPIDDLHVNGELTLGENIGDLSGLTVAYRAYRRSLGGQEAPVIDGFTGDQRFFLGWAQIWRRKFRDAELRNRVMTDPHSPAMYRVLGVVPNMPEFHAAFGTQPGDALWRAPEERVKVW